MIIDIIYKIKDMLPSHEVTYTSTEQTLSDSDITEEDEEEQEQENDFSESKKEEGKSDDTEKFSNDGFEDGDNSDESENESKINELCDDTYNRFEKEFTLIEQLGKGGFGVCCSFHFNLFFLIFS